MGETIRLTVSQADHTPLIRFNLYGACSRDVERPATVHCPDSPSEGNGIIDDSYAPDFVETNLVFHDTGPEVPNQCSLVHPDRQASEQNAQDDESGELDPKTSLRSCHPREGKHAPYCHPDHEEQNWVGDLRVLIEVLTWLI